MITSRADDPGVDFVSRYFAPAFGIDEDPATGSTHCCPGTVLEPAAEQADASSRGRCRRAAER